MIMQPNSVRTYGLFLDAATSEVIDHKSFRVSNVYPKDVCCQVLSLQVEKRYQSNVTTLITNKCMSRFSKELPHTSNNNNNTGQTNVSAVAWNKYTYY